MNDDELPDAICQNIDISLDQNGDYVVDENLINDGSSDNCGVASLSVSPSTIPCFHVANTQTVTLTVTDVHGNESTCTANVTLLGDDDCDGVGNVCDQCPGGDDQVDENGDGFPDCIVYPGWDDLLEEWGCPTGNGNNEKVFMCHDGNTLCVSENSLASHLAHGDYIGPCGNASCAQSLIAPTNGNNIQFAATLEQQGKAPEVGLWWAVSQPDSIAGYMVEKSRDGQHFETVGEQTGEGGKVYSMTDPNLQEGEWMYRLKVTNHDGSTHYPQPKWLDITLPDDYVLFPNPASTQIRVSLKQAVGKPALVQMVNGQGVIVQEQQFNELPQAPLSFDLSGLRDGMYWLNIQVEGRKARARKIVVAK